MYCSLLGEGNEILIACNLSVPAWGLDSAGYTISQTVSVEKEKKMAVPSESPTGCQPHCHLCCAVTTLGSSPIFPMGGGC